MFADLIPNARLTDFGIEGPASAFGQAATAPVVSKVPVIPGAPAMATPSAPVTPTAPPAAPGAPPTGALSAWDTFYNSPTFQVPLQQGLKAVNTKYAAMGSLESGAAMKAINNYAQGQASSALGSYLDDLYRQEALGESAAAATAGVGEGLVSQISANNNNAASAAGNAALASGNANASMFNSIGGAIGTGAGQIAGALSSSFGRIPTPNFSQSATVDPALLNPQPAPFLPTVF